MKRIILMITAAALAWSVGAQQNITSENIGFFQSVSLSGNLNVELIPAEANAIDVTLIDSEITRFKWSVGDSGLTVSLKPSQRSAGVANVKIYYADTIRYMSVSASQIMVEQPMRGDILKITLSGGGKLTGHFEVKDLELDVTGNSAAQVSGSARYLTLRANEKSRVDTRETETISADVDAATGAEVYVSVSERLVATAKTSSTIFYKGNPEILKDRTGRINLGASVLNIGK